MKRGKEEEKKKSEDREKHDLSNSAEIAKFQARQGRTRTNDETKDRKRSAL